MQIPLFCELIEEGVDVVAPEGIVYSTKPRKAVGLDGRNYYIKGPDLNVVVAEAVAHQLARSLGLSVPDFGVAMLQNGRGPLFASKEVLRCYRHVDLWIREGRTINSSEILPLITAFDIWVVNKDRNVGNLVGREEIGAGGRLSIIAIDFEKSMALRGPYPLTTVPNIRPSALWPSGTLGHLMVGQPIPRKFCDALKRITGNHVLDAFARVEARINCEIPWKENSALLLAKRAERIETLVAEVWR